MNTVPLPLSSPSSSRRTGRLLGWFQSAFSLALILGPVWGGSVFGTVGPRAVFAVSAGLMVLALGLSLGMQRLPLATVEQPRETMRLHVHH